MSTSSFKSKIPGIREIKLLLNVDKDDINKELFPDIKSNGENDNRSFNKHISNNELNLYPLTMNIANYIGVKFAIPSILSTEINAGIYMRKSSTFIPAFPDKSKPAFRVIVHLGNEDVYILETISCNDKLKNSMNEKSIHLTDKEVMALGPSILITQNISVKKGIHLTIPMNSLQNGKQNSSRSSIRPKNYTRTTIIIDYLLDDVSGENIAEIGKKIESGENTIEEATKNIVDDKYISSLNAAIKSVIPKNEIDEDDNECIKNINKLLDEM